MIQLQRNYNNSFTNEGELLQQQLTYEEYLDLAKIPYCEGISSRVVAALCQRVRQTELTIELIAGDMHLTKRTLQRRLQSQNTSFAQLRDDVRFHYAIKFLIDEGMRVDQVSKYLNFSDRTSFTNAFKRWAGMSPSVFKRKFMR